MRQEGCAYDAKGNCVPLGGQETRDEIAEARTAEQGYEKTQYL